MHTVVATAGGTHIPCRLFIWVIVREIYRPTLATYLHIYRCITRALAPAKTNKYKHAGCASVLAYVFACVNVFAEPPCQSSDHLGLACCDHHGEQVTMLPDNLNLRADTF